MQGLVQAALKDVGGPYCSQLVVGRVDIPAVAAFVIVLAPQMLFEIVGITDIFIAIIADEVERGVVKVTVKRFARYE